MRKYYFAVVITILIASAMLFGSCNQTPDPVAPVIPAVPVVTEDSAGPDGPDNIQNPTEPKDSSEPAGNTDNTDDQDDTTTDPENTPDVIATDDPSDTPVDTTEPTSPARTDNPDNTGNTDNTSLEIIQETTPRAGVTQTTTATTDRTGTQTTTQPATPAPATQPPTQPQTPAPTPAPTTQPQTQPQTPAPTPAPTTQAPTEPPVVNLPPPVHFTLTPSAPGTTVHTDDRLVGVSTLDYSNSSQGYVMLKHSGSENRIVVQIVAPNSVTYQYELTGNTAFIVCPLQGGNGTYTVRILEQLEGNSARALLNTEISVSLDNEFLPFLYPNIKVNFSASSTSVTKAAELTRGMTTDLEKIEAVYNYIITNIVYDNDKAKSLPATGSYTSNPDETLRLGKGVCFDYSILLAAMLRSQAIPVQLVEGNVAPNNIRHAWNLVHTSERGTVVSISFGGSWTLMDSTFGAGMNRSDLASFIGGGTGYTADKSY